MGLPAMPREGLVSEGDALEASLCTAHLSPVRHGGAVALHSPLPTIPLHVPAVSRHRDVWGPCLQMYWSSELTSVLL